MPGTNTALKGPYRSEVGSQVPGPGFIAIFVGFQVVWGGFQAGKTVIPVSIMGPMGHGGWGGVYLVSLHELN